MKRVKKDRRKLNNHGFSMVELLIAVAILGVVSLTIYSFMNTGARFYRKTSSDADIQSEAQLAANAISDLIVDCEVNISYDDTITNVVSGSGASGTIPVNGRILEISNRDYQFLIFHRDTNLFYLERRPSAGDPNQYEAYNINNAELLAQNITEFNVDLSRVSGQGKGKNIVTFTMTYEKGGRVYRGNYQVNLRNSVTVSANGITPVSDDPNLTRITVTPAPITIDVKGKDNPACPPEQKEKEFTANSDATNVGRDDIFSWELKSMDGSAVTCASPVGDTNKKKFTIRIADDLTDVPSSIKVVATSTVENKDTHTYATGEAMVYFKKILNLNITPTRGVTNDLMDPESSAIFAANITDYNLRPEDKRCTWRFEYKKGASGEWAVCNSASIATGRSMGTSYSVKLGSDADEHYSFRLTATSEWDPTWSAQYIFGVTKKETLPGIDSPSRGVEIDLTALFTTGVKSDQHWDNPEGMETIYDAKLQNYSSQDADILHIVTRDGKAYAYIDYGEVRYTSGADAILFYDAKNIEIELFYTDKDGNKHSKDGINWSLTPVRIVPSKPLRNGNILLPKGGTYDVTFTVEGYNISTKNQIGIYMEADGNMQNLNAHEYGMLDFNPYLSVNYTGPLGNRYTLIETGMFKITSKANQNMYPTDAIPMKVTVNDFYRLVTQYKAGDQSYLERASYDFNVYVANVEGRDMFVQGPKNTTDKWQETTIVYNGNATQGVVKTNVSVDAGAPFYPGGSQSRISFEAVTKDEIDKETGETKKVVSYYVMKIDEQEYYYNTTYNCWRRSS